jgi:hypothetical protein
MSMDPKDIHLTRSLLWITGIIVAGLCASIAVAVYAPTGSATATVDHAQMAAAQPATPAVEKSDWNVWTETNALTGRKTTKATTTSWSGTGEYDKVTLGVRKGEHLDILLDTHLVLFEDSNLTVRFRFDDGRTHAERWIPSTDRYALFSPHPARFLDQLKKARRVTMEYHPYDTEAKSVVFDVANLPVLNSK